MIVIAPAFFSFDSKKQTIICEKLQWDIQKYDSHCPSIIISLWFQEIDSHFYLYMQ